jgi:O-antigen/teichoic acid export membrane protein
VLKSVGSNWAVTVVTVAAAYVLTPFTLHTLGDAGYGTWTLITSISGYLALLVLGVPMASVRYFAEHVATGDRRELNRAIGSCTGLYLLLGGAALVIGAGLYALFNLSYDIPTTIRRDADWAFALTVVYIAVGFVGMLPEGVLSAYEAFLPRNVARLASTVLRVSLTFGLLTWRPTLSVLAFIQLACLAFDFFVCAALILHYYPDTRVRLGDFDWGLVKKIFSFSMFVLVLSAGARLSFQTDSLVIAKFQDVSAIPYFTVANNFVIYLMEFVVAIAAVVMPAATRLKTQGRVAELRETFLKWSKIALSVTLMAGLFLIVLGPRFIAWWIEPRYEEPAGQVLQILMVSYLVFLPVRGVALPILMGLGKPGIPTIGFLIAGLVNLGLSIALARPLGIAGVALGTAIPNVAYAGVVLVQACRELQTPVPDFLRYVVPRALLGALPVLALLLWFKFGLDVRGIGQLTGAGVAMTLLFAVLWVFFVYRNDPYVDLRRGLVSQRGEAQS